MDIIVLEAKSALEIVYYTATGNFQESVYFDTFFPQSLRDDPTFVAKVQGVFEKMVSFLAGSDKEYKWYLSCNNKTPMCQKGAFVHTIDWAKGPHINFCDKFFDSDSGIESTADMVKHCASIDLGAAQRLRAVVIVHAFLHASSVMDPDGSYVPTYLFFSATA